MRWEVLLVLLGCYVAWHLMKTKQQIRNSNQKGAVAASLFNGFFR